MKILLATSILVSSLFSLEWNNYETAAQKSQSECKPIMLVVHQEECGACKELFSTIKKSRLINGVLEDYVVAQISAQEAYQKYGTRVKATPTIYALDSSYKELIPAIEGLPSDNLEFVEYLQYGSIAYESTGCKKK